MTIASLHINRPASINIRRVMHCPTCDRRRRFSAFDQLWYGPTWTCLGCGDSWSDGMRLERPFRPRWRTEARRRAADRWTNAVRNLGPEHRAWLDKQMAHYQGPAVEDVHLPAEVAS